MGTCVGQRNHKCFTLYNFFTMALCIFTLSLNVTTLVRCRGIAFGDPEDEYFFHLQVPSLLMGIYTLAVAVLVGFLGAYHVCLVVSNHTTQELMRDKYTMWGGNHYDQGTCSSQNWRYCWNIQESLIFNKEVAEATVSRIRDPTMSVSDSYKGLQIWNQHVIDTGLITMVEKEKDDAISLGQSQQAVGMDDVKSIKSKVSLRSEMPALASEGDDQISRVDAARS